MMSFVAVVHYSYWFSLPPEKFPWVISWWRSGFAPDKQVCFRVTKDSKTWPCYPGSLLYIQSPLFASCSWWMSSLWRQKNGFVMPLETFFLKKVCCMLAKSPLCSNCVNFLTFFSLPQSHLFLPASTGLYVRGKIPNASFFLSKSQGYVRTFWKFIILHVPGSFFPYKIRTKVCFITCHPEIAWKTT